MPAPVAAIFGRLAAAGRFSGPAGRAVRGGVRTGLPGFELVDRTTRWADNRQAELYRIIQRHTLRFHRDARRLVGQRAYPPPSTPGTPPAVRTGTLRRNIEQEVVTDGHDIVGRVGTRLRYGRFLELGTSRMAERPYLRPALRRIRPAFESDLRSWQSRLGRG